jgi:hypothetical protein
MYKIDKLKELFNCNICNQLLKNLIILPCNETICFNCLNELKPFLAESKVFKCSLCDKDHIEPDDGFAKDKKTQLLLDLHIDQINFYNMFPKFEECKNQLHDLNEKLKEICSIQKDPSNFIYNYFEKIINQIDIHREKLIEEINLYSDVTIKKIKNIEKSLNINKNTDEISKEICYLQIELEDLNNDFDSFMISDLKISKIAEKAEDLKPILSTKLNEFEKILLDHKYYVFKPVELKTENLFGKFQEVFKIKQSIQINIHF